MEKWQSNAEWPIGVCSTRNGDNVTTDRHRTRAEAENVCFMLERDGFGGLGKHFPIRTWVCEVEQ